MFFKINLHTSLHIALIITPKAPAETLAVTVVEIKQLPKIEPIDRKNELSCLEKTKKRQEENIFELQDWYGQFWTIYWTATDTVYTPKTKETDVKPTDYQIIIAKQFLFFQLTVFSSIAWYWKKQLFITKMNSIRKKWILSTEIFSIVLGSESVVWAKKGLQAYFWKRCSVIKIHFFRWDEAKWPIWWNIWFWRLVIGLYYVLIQVVDTTVTIARWYCSTAVTYCQRTKLVLHDLTRTKLTFLCSLVPITFLPLDKSLSASIFKSASFWSSISCFVLVFRFAEKNVGQKMWVL